MFTWEYQVICKSYEEAIIPKTSRAQFSMLFKYRNLDFPIDFHINLFTEMDSSPMSTVQYYYMAQKFGDFK